MSSPDSPGSPFVTATTYRRPINVAGVDPFEVELRVLNSGHRAALRDALAMEFGTDDSTELKAKLGTMEIHTVQMALVSWTIEPGPTRATVERLKPDVLAAIRDHVAWGRHPDNDPEPEAAEATEGQRAELELEELQDGEEAAAVPLASSAGGVGAGF